MAKALLLLASGNIFLIPMSKKNLTAGKNWSAIGNTFLRLTKAKTSPSVLKGLHISTSKKMLLVLMFPRHLKKRNLQTISIANMSARGVPLCLHVLDRPSKL